MPLADITQSAVMQVASHALDAANLRHLAIMSNIANAGDPAYAPQRVEFEQALRAALAQAADADRGPAASRVVARLVTDQQPMALDQQIAALSRNTLHYQALLKTLNAELELLGLAASDGRR